MGMVVQCSLPSPVPCAAPFADGCQPFTTSACVDKYQGLRSFYNQQTLLCEPLVQCLQAGQVRDAQNNVCHEGPHRSPDGLMDPELDASEAEVVLVPVVDLFVTQHQGVFCLCSEEPGPGLRAHIQPS